MSVGPNGAALWAAFLEAQARDNLASAAHARAWSLVQKTGTDVVLMRRAWEAWRETATPEQVEGVIQDRALRVESLASRLEALLRHGHALREGLSADYPVIVSLLAQVERSYVDVMGQQVPPDPAISNGDVDG